MSGYVTVPYTWNAHTCQSIWMTASREDRSQPSLSSRRPNAFQKVPDERYQTLSIVGELSQQGRDHPIGAYRCPVPTFRI